MDSPHSQSHSTQQHRMRAQSNLAHNNHHRGAVQKRSSSFSRSVSTTQVDRLYQLAIEQQQQQQQQQQTNPNPIDGGAIPLTSAPSHWLTPQSSPQPHVYSEPITDSFPQWTVPTPPRSDSGLPTVSLDANEVPVTTGISSTCDFSFDQQPTASAEMSSLGFLLPSQYGAGSIEAEPSSYNMDQNYIPPPRMSQPVSTSGAVGYAQTISSSPALYQSRSAPATHPGVRRHSDLQNPNNLSGSPYGGAYRRISSSYDSVSSADYSMPPAQTIPSISGLTQSPQPSPHLGSGMMPSFNPNTSRSPNLYDTSTMYNQQYVSAPSSMAPLYGQSVTNYPHPPFVGSSSDVLSTTKPLGSDNASSSIRVLNQRPKPQCWEHGCNGRQFSTFSNLLRHQREKSGTASKSYCPKCGAEFTRTTARNGHLAHDKCTKGQQGRRESEDDK